MEASCPVCLQSQTRLSVVISCSHSICMSCFIHLVKRECPLCRYEFERDLPMIKEDTKHNLIQYLHMQPKVDRSGLLREDVLEVYPPRSLSPSS